MYNIVLFGGVDGYSRKVMYLGASTNNRASTAYGFFLEATQRHGVPLRIERLWRDVRVIVTNKYSAILLSLEEDGLLDISSTNDLFCVHYIILPRLQMDLGIFTEGWNHHPLSTERNQCPEQLWQLGLMQTNIDQPESPEEPDVDWEIAADHDGEEDAGIVVPEFDCPLSPEDITELQSIFQQIDPNTPVKELYLLCREYVAERCGS
ncbi:uncharacterized protein LOC117473135 isoform X2 [Trematomus bernacchii]|uniref:uncharacterized protein LOC117473135 isoform X2 n=1 Tax=Trematomus bernacchii TaxID=40690 RepID=UPI00146C91A2|nr:uncharacterized protein LOC117473135 isoform X2 [Trematomus bernacchii]